MGDTDRSHDKSPFDIEEYRSRYGGAKADDLNNPEYFAGDLEIPGPLALGKRGRGLDGEINPEPFDVEGLIPRKKVQSMAGDLADSPFVRDPHPGRIHGGGPV